MDKQFKDAIKKKHLPITLLFMENTTTKNTVAMINVTISYAHGEKIIGYDFYKPISTY